MYCHVHKMYRKMKGSSSEYSTATAAALGSPDVFLYKKERKRKEATSAIENST